MRDALQRLDDAGHVAYIVGGSVRDFLLGVPLKDHDIATSASPAELCRLFPDAVTVGKAFGVLKIPVPPEAREKGAEFLEIATFREDLEYGEDHRHPRGVRFAGPAEDARRRDFTVNSLFFDPKSSRILDAAGGMQDLKDRVIRAIGEPRERFREDALRLLRAVRFAVRLGFELEAETAEAIRANAKLLARISGERVRDELTAMLRGPRPHEALATLSRLGLLRVVLPEIEALHGVEQSAVFHPEGDVWTHTLRTLQWLERRNPERSVTLAWGALLHDVGKPGAAKRSAGKNFNGHETDGGKLAFSIGTRLKMSRSEIDRIVALVQDHLKFKDVFQMRESTLGRFLRQPHFEELLAVHQADALASDGNLAFHEFCASRLSELRKGASRELPRLIDGEDLIQLGLQPGPGFSEILRTIEDLALERKLATKEEALEYVVRHFVK
ncbi:MAG: CCA tRNA nucleotidyltransferase [Oligoflexia bacterium]|nr:CCA tRNA nucleotidyltransferase [Oligoflexia bacterium]